MGFVVWLLNHFFRLPEPIRFILVGGGNTVIGYTLFLAMYEIFPTLNYQVILFLNFILSSWVCFVNLKIFVFRTSGKWLKEYIKALSSYTLVYVINAFLLMIFVEFLGLHILLSQAISAILAAVVSYFSHKLFSFRH